MYISSRQYLHVCTCRISSRPSIAVLTSSIGDSAVGSLSETSRGPEHTRERLATYTEEKKISSCPQMDKTSCLHEGKSETTCASVCTRSMMSSRLVKWCVLQPSARSTSSWVACFLTARSRSSAMTVSWGITTISINSSWKRSKKKRREFYLLI